MRRLLILGLSILTATGAMAGTLPEVKARPSKKEPPRESLEQPMVLQQEEDKIGPPKPSPNKEFDPIGIAASYRLPERETKIAAHYIGLSNGTGGQFYSALEKPLLAVLEEVLGSQLVNGTDIVFVIDHTSSMEDDIDVIRVDVQRLIRKFEAVGGIRVGIVTFSDVKSGSKYGYCSHGLSDDYGGLAGFLGGIELLGSVEDIYGAIWKTVDEFKWKSKSKRMIVLISDDKPATGKDTNYTEEDVLYKCAKSGVQTNLYPVLVDKYSPVKQ
ncbi:MAG: vWA domain-containing protein [Bacteroidia bacterium]